MWKLFQSSPENLGKMVKRTFLRARTEEQCWRSFWQHLSYVSFEIRVEAMSLILYFTGITTFLMEHFQKNCHKLLLRNMVNCGSTCMASWNNSVPEVCQTQYFWIFPVWPCDTTFSVHLQILLGKPFISRDMFQLTNFWPWHLSLRPIVTILH